MPSYDKGFQAVFISWDTLFHHCKISEIYTPPTARHLSLSLCFTITFHHLTRDSLIQCFLHSQRILVLQATYSVVLPVPVPLKRHAVYAGKGLAFGRAISCQKPCQTDLTYAGAMWNALDSLSCWVVGVRKGSQSQKPCQNKYRNLIHAPAWPASVKLSIPCHHGKCMFNKDDDDDKL